MRGEQPSCRPLAALCGGSPPLARGTGKQRELNSHRLGITPACAGNRSPAQQNPPAAQDHPRLRGEQGNPACAASRALGSPPLARGTDGEIRRRKRRDGITPACAGNRLTDKPTQKQLEDHPRLRGEQILRRGKCARFVGSPPLARGTDKLQGSTQRRVGITPACAGNSHRDSPLGRRIRDHPRLRGEQIAGGLADLTREGSPPLARGTVTTCPRERKYAGITPACAGNSLHSPVITNLRGDHPRLRGEQSQLLLILYLVLGSPPLARGTATDVD